MYCVYHYILLTYYAIALFYDVYIIIINIIWQVSVICNILLSNATCESLSP